MVGVLGMSVMILIVGFYSAKISFFILGYSIITIGTSFAKNTVLGFVKSFSEDSIKAIGISISFTNMIGNLYCIVMERWLNLDQYYLYFVPTICFIGLLFPIYFL